LFEYRWNRYAFTRNAIADPADVNDVLPYIEVFNELYFEAIKKVSGAEDFIKNETPIRIFLLGSGLNYGGKESFGEGTVGQAGNIRPNRLTLGGLNEFGRLLKEGTDTQFLNYIYEKRTTSTPGEGGEVSFIYHEYTHYIDRKRDIPKGFEKPSFNEYIRASSTYKRVSKKNAREKGFMLPYGMQNEHEDFATYVHIMTWKPASVIEEEYLLGDAAKIKYKMVYDYFKKLNLDLLELRDYLHSDEVKDKILAIKKKYE